MREPSKVDSAKCLGLTLDTKLSWMLNIQERGKQHQSQSSPPLDWWWRSVQDTNTVKLDIPTTGVVTEELDLALYV